MALEGAWDMMLLDITRPKNNGIKVREEVKAAKAKLPTLC
jgi:DNA-binding response OmpR family regulator